MIISGRVSLPYPSFLTAWLALGLGEPPTALLPARVDPPAGRTLAEITEWAWQDLFERDLALGRWLDDAFAGTLRVLARAATRYYALYHEGGDTRSVLVACSRVVASVDGGTVTLRPCWSDSGAKAFVDALPQVPKAPGDAVCAPAGELARAPSTGVTSTVRPTGPAARMRRLLALPRTGGGQLYVARRDREGHYRPCARPLSYLDTEAGRFIAAEQRSGDGTSWRSLVPADAAILRKRISEMLAALTEAARAGPHGSDPERPVRATPR